MIINWLDNNILTIMNYNDSTSFLELNNLTTKTDNDKNTVFLSKLINKYSNKTKYKVSKVFYLTNTNWLLGKNKKTIKWHKFSDIDDNQEFNKVEKHLLSFVNNDESWFWTWWMWSKILSWLECLKNDVDEIYISNSKDWMSVKNKCTLISK